MESPGSTNHPGELPTSEGNLKSGGPGIETEVDLAKDDERDNFSLDEEYGEEYGEFGEDDEEDEISHQDDGELEAVGDEM